DWSSDVCSSDLLHQVAQPAVEVIALARTPRRQIAVPVETRKVDEWTDVDFCLYSRPSAPLELGRQFQNRRRSTLQLAEMKRQVRLVQLLPESAYHLPLVTRQHNGVPI